jgi:hypothetical protein
MVLSKRQHLQTHVSYVTLLIRLSTVDTLTQETKKTQHLITKISWLTSFEEIIPVYTEKRMEPTSMHRCGKMQSY